MKYNEIDAIILDIDGTLIDDRLQIHEKTVEAVYKLKAARKLVFFCSGRMFKSAKIFIDKYFDSSFPVISYNGAFVNSNTLEEPFFFHFLEKNTAIEIIDFLRNEKVHFQAYIDEELVAEKSCKEITDYSLHAGVGFKIVPDLSLEISTNAKCPVKLLAIAEENRLEEVKAKALKKFEARAEIFKSFSVYLDFIPKKTNKGIAIIETSKYFKFDLNKTLMIGDSENDIYGFKVVGFPVAMGNSSENVKRHSVFVSESNNNLGAFFALNHFFPNIV